VTRAAEGTGHRAAPAEAVMVTELRDGSRHERPDHVVGEEPLEIRLAGPGVGAEPEPVAVTMRTPGHDFELAVGFLLGEGLLRGQHDVRAVKYCELPEGDPQQFNVVTVIAAGPVDVRGRQRSATVSASCGVCGTATLDALQDRCPAVPEGATLDAEVLMSLPGRLRRHQRIFERTGGLHAAGLYGADGRMLAVREDVGRHNAVDKLVGWASLQRRLPLSEAVLVVSGRVSFEIVQKAAVAGIPVLAAVSAPSSLAVATAQSLGMTLAGFVRDGRANLYAAPWRVVSAPAGNAPDRPEMP
jgi:FdhD protein